MKEWILVFSFQNKGRIFYRWGACPTCPKSIIHIRPKASSSNYIKNSFHYHELQSSLTTAVLPLHLFYFHRRVHLNKKLLPQKGHCTSLECRSQSGHRCLSPSWWLVSFVVLSMNIGLSLPQRNICCELAHFHNQWAELFYPDSPSVHMPYAFL